MLVKECKLRSGDLVMISWLEDRPLKVGQHVRLKDSDEPSRWWIVQEIFEPAVDKQKIYRGWNNNI